MHSTATEITTRAADGLPPLTVTFREARRISGLGLTTLWLLAREHQIETVRVGRRTLITYRGLARLLLPAEPAAPQPRSRGRPTKRPASAILPASRAGQ